MEVELVKGEDWQGLFIDDSLRTENHRLETIEVLKEIALSWYDGFGLTVKVYVGKDFKQTRYLVELN